MNASVFFFVGSLFSLLAIWGLVWGPPPTSVGPSSLGSRLIVCGQHFVIGALPGPTGVGVPVDMLLSL